MVSNKIALASSCLALVWNVVSGSGAARSAAHSTIVPPVLPAHKTNKMPSSLLFLGHLHPFLVKTTGESMSGNHHALLVRGGGLGGGRNNNDLHDNIKDDYDDNHTRNGDGIRILSKKATVIQVHGIVCTVLGVMYGLESMGWVTVPFLGPAAAFPGLFLTKTTTNPSSLLEPLLENHGNDNVMALQTMVRAMASFMIGTGLMEVQLSYEPAVQTVFLLYHVLLVSATVVGAIHQYSNPSTTMTNAMLWASLLTPLTTAGFGIAGFLF
mmetsp:Transcript_16064/g.29227  ORF Transcript_16064/g.29227 Transcript_16064/m.29227 type:complete len:268 (-) Transcript_16064:82-885(-)